MNWWWVFRGRTWQNKLLSQHICSLIAAPYLYDLNTTEERRVCRSLCSLFWACSLFCWEILFKEANGIWHKKPIFSSSHLAVGSVGSTTANDNTSLLDKLFLIFNISTRLKTLEHIFFLLNKNFIRIRKWPLADVFLLVLSQFRLSHIRPLGAIYSLIGFCMCSAQTFLTVGHLIIMDRHHGNYGTHTTYVEQMLQSSPSPNQLEPWADKQKRNINNLNDLHGWRWFRSQSTKPTCTHTHPHTHTDKSQLIFSLNRNVYDPRRVHEHCWFIVRTDDHQILLIINY